VGQLLKAMTRGTTATAFRERQRQATKCQQLAQERLGGRHTHFNTSADQGSD